MATLAVALAVFQFGSAFVMYGCFPAAGCRPGSVPPRLVRPVGRSGQCPVVVHCLYALGFEATDTRVLFHSLFGCFFYGAFVTKMLLLTRKEWPRGCCRSPGCGLLRAGLRVVDVCSVVLRHQRGSFLDPVGSSQRGGPQSLCSPATAQLQPKRKSHPCISTRSANPAEPSSPGGLGLAATALAACSSYGNKPEAASSARRRPDRRAHRHPAQRPPWPRPPTSRSGRV
jgi:hypothetical protein